MMRLIEQGEKTAINFHVKGDVGPVQFSSPIGTSIRAGWWLVTNALQPMPGTKRPSGISMTRWNGGAT
jgi:hypothetical protein